MNDAQQLAEKLHTAIRLSFPVINVLTFETARAAMAMEKIADQTGKAFIEAQFKELPTRAYLQRLLDEGKKKKSDNKGLVVFDQFFFDRSRINPETLPALKSSLDFMENQGINYVVTGRDSIPDEFVYHVQLAPMTDTEITDLIQTCEGFIKEGAKLFSDEERAVIAKNARGLSHTQMKNVFTYCSFLKHKGVPYLPEIRAEKAHILRDVGLDVLTPVELSAVGGLENLKEFLATRKAGWDKGLPIKGILLAGVPGGGKTLTAKAVAGVLGTSLVRLDMGRFYSKYLGETEKLFSRALQTVDDISPVVLLIDEIEKFFGQAEGEHEVSRRLLGSFLYWLQERQGRTFVVATANQIHLLPPELMRAGRWDRTFFFDLPNRAEREKIFEIHINKVSDGKVAEFDMEALLQKSEGFTGAEIEQAVVDAMYIANAGGASVLNEHVLTAIDSITPTSETRRDDIARIRGLREQGFYPANQSDDKDGAGVAGGRRVSVE